MTARIDKEGAEYILTVGGKGLEFDTLGEAVEYADVNGLSLTETPEVFGYRIGGLVVMLSEGGHDRQGVMQGLEDGLDPAWKDAALELADLLTKWAKAQA